MKIWESTHVFDHPWERVVHAAWRKYPNPISKAVSGMDVLDRHIDERGVLQTRRLIQTRWDIPSWVTGLIGLRNPNYSHETSEVNPFDKTLTLKTVNLDCKGFVSVDEKLTYAPHPDDPKKTLLTQSTEVCMYGVPLVAKLESMLLSQFSTNSHKGRSALEWVIGNISREYDELTAKISDEYTQISQHLAKEVDHITTKVDKGVDDILISGLQRRRIKSFSAERKAQETGWEATL
jgi:hypothetical protein